MKSPDLRVGSKDAARATSLWLSCFCLLLARPESAFSAIVVNGNLAFLGNEVEVDSFDSSNPALSTDGQYDPAKSGDGGNIYVGQSSSNSASIGNGLIFGTLFTGAGVSYSLGANGAIGTHPWLYAGGTGIEPGHSLTTNFVLKDITVPNSSSFPAPTSGTVVIQTGPSTYQTNFYDDVLRGGNYLATSLGNTIVTGPSTLVMTGNIGGNIIISPGGSLCVYVQGSSLSFNINHVTNETGVASNLVILCSPSVTTVSVGGGGSFAGVLDAPEAIIALIGGGNGIDFSGSILVNSLHASGHARIHCDESLGQFGYLLFPAPPQSPTLLPSVSSNGLFQFYVQGTAGDNCAVETSTDLFNWVPIFTNVAPYTFTDTNGMSLDHNFYRTIYVQ